MLCQIDSQNHDELNLTLSGMSVEERKREIRSQRQSYYTESKSRRVRWFVVLLLASLETSEERD